MIDLLTRDSARGMTGIGVLILFIALVLVAAIASGLILDTAGMLENTAQDTGEQSISEVSDRISILSASGDVTANAEIGTIRLVLYRSPGAGDVNLRYSTLEYFSPYGTAFLVHDSEFQAIEDNHRALEQFTERLGRFKVTALKDSKGSVPVLSSRSDRAELLIPLYEPSATGPIDSNVSSGQVSAGRPHAMQRLHPGDTATIRITTQNGATSMYIINVPESLVGEKGGSVLL